MTGLMCRYVLCIPERNLRTRRGTSLYVFSCLHSFTVLRTVASTVLPLVSKYIRVCALIDQTRLHRFDQTRTRPDTHAGSGCFGTCSKVSREPEPRRDECCSHTLELVPKYGWRYGCQIQKNGKHQIHIPIHIPHQLMQIMHHLPLLLTHYRMMILLIAHTHKLLL